MARSQAVRQPPHEDGHGTTKEARSIKPTDWRVGWKPLLWGSALVVAADVFLWFWNYNFMFSAGLNSASVEFSRYYRSLFWAELITLGVFTGAWFGWLIRTGREMAGEPCERAEEVRRIAILWSIVGITSLSVYMEASFWPNWDGSWHQTMVRDTALTPTHIPMFYFFFPLSSVLAIGAYLYGRFRIPALYGGDKGFPWSFFLLISAAVLECMAVAANEWGHSLWISEEIFSVPFHWPFIVYGWLASGMFAVWGETIIRLLEIEKAEEAANASAPLRPHLVAD